MKRFLAGMVVGFILALAVPAAAGVYGQFQGYDVVRVLVNGKEVQSDVPAIIINGRTMVPLRFISEALGAKIGWNETLRLAWIEGKVPPPVDKNFVNDTIQQLVRRYKDRMLKATGGVSISEDEAQKLITESSQDLSAVISLFAGVLFSPGQDWTKEGVQLLLLNQAIASELGFWNMYQQALHTHSFDIPRAQAAPMSYWYALIQTQIGK